MYVFGVYNYEYDTGVSKYYHLPLSERNFAIKRFYQLVWDDSAAMNASGWYKCNRKPGTPDIFRDEISKEGLEYFGITPAPVTQRTTEPANEIPSDSDKKRKKKGIWSRIIKKLNPNKMEDTGEDGNK